MEHLPDKTLGRLRDLIDAPELSGTKYRLLRAIASGGMGNIYLVHDAELRRDVALKLLSTPLESESLYARMIREARITALLEHPAILPIHDVGRLPDGRPFYIMKHVQGVTFTSYLDSQPALAERLVVLQKLCQAVGFAHSRGVMHRDLKPENVMVGTFGEVLLIDWGAACVIGQSVSDQEDLETSGAISSTATAEGTIIGTPAYMSPEQASGDGTRVDTRTDIFGLGGILYFMLTLRPLYPTSDRESAIRAATAYDIQLTPLQNRSIPKQVSAICRKALSRDPALRYQTAQEFESDLGRFLAGEPVSAYRENIVERLGRWLGRHRFVVFMVLAYIVLRIVIFFWLGR
jgi:serine/threonine protein kinase